MTRSYMKKNLKIPQNTVRIVEISKISGYKINTQNSAVFLYTKNGQSDKEFKKTILFTVAPKTLKY